MTTEWDNSIRCPHCDGLNDADAEWCMQCSARLRPARKTIDMGAGAPGFSEIVAGGLGVLAGEANEGSDEGIAQAFSVEGDAVKWTCGRCQHRNDIRASACESCGRSFAESARWIADTSVVPKKQGRSTLKALGMLSVGAVLMRLVAGLVSPWAAFALFGGILLRFVIRSFRD